MQTPGGDETVLPPLLADLVVGLTKYLVRGDVAQGWWHVEYEVLDGVVFGPRVQPIDSTVESRGRENGPAV